MEPEDKALAHQSETIDSLRGVIAILGRTVEALTPNGGGTQGASLPTGHVSISRDKLEKLLEAQETTRETAKWADELEKRVLELERLLEPVSVMLGYGGDVTPDFLKYLEGRPRNVEPATAFLLPDGTHTNVVAEALTAWRGANPEIEEAARQKAAAAKFGG